MRSRRRRAASARRGTMSEDVCGTADQRLRCECEFMRNYLHIQDACRSFKFVVDNWESCKNETYNVGNDEINMNKLQLAQKIQQHIPLEIIKAEINSDPDIRDYEVSSQKIYDKGFSCQNSLDDGIKQLIKAYGIIESPWFANY